MSYKCEICNYDTNIKSNYTRHINTNKHYIKTTKKSNPTNISLPPSQMTTEIKKQVVCSFCNLSFSRTSSLTRHRKICTNKENSKDNEYKLLRQQIEQLNEFIKLNKTTSNTYNISVKNYIQQNYSNAPPLTKLDNYSLIEQGNENESDLISNLIYNYNHSQLDKYLGNFLVKYYKKDDSSKQSIWNSDVSRMTYIIKELLENKKSIWNHDYKGVKTKEYIITPLVKYIREYIADHLNNFTLDINSFTAKECEKIAIRQVVLAKILQYIDTDLTDDVVKYIAPMFKLKKDIDDRSNDVIIDLDQPNYMSYDI